MKQYSEPATKEDIKNLDKRFTKKFVTKKDLEKFATKDDLKKHINALEIRTDIKMENLERRIDDKARKYRDDVLTVMDGIAKDLKTIVQEMMILNEQGRQMFARIENHEARITHLETNQNHN